MKLLKIFFKKIILNKVVAKIALKPLLKLDNFVYFLIGQYAHLASEKGYPKHDIVKHADWFISHLDRSMTILDVGSNTGEMTLKMSKHVTLVYGIEINPSLDKVAKKKIRTNLKFICADATKYDYSLIEAIDYITLSNVFEHIEDRIGFLKSLNNKVNWINEPHYLIRVPMINRHWVVYLKKQLGIEHRLDKTHFIEYTKESFYKEMNEANLGVVNFDVKWGEIYAECIKK